MSKKNKIRRPKARLPKGMRDIEPREIRAMNGMLERIRHVYELYGFEPLEILDGEIECGREDIYTYVFQRGSR